MPPPTPRVSKLHRTTFNQRKRPLTSGSSGRSGAGGHHAGAKRSKDDDRNHHVRDDDDDDEGNENPTSTVLRNAAKALAKKKRRVSDRTREKRRLEYERRAASVGDAEAEPNKEWCAYYNKALGSTEERAKVAAALGRGPLLALRVVAGGPSESTTRAELVRRKFAKHAHQPELFVWNSQVADPHGLAQAEVDRVVEGETRTLHAFRQSEAAYVAVHALDVRAGHAVLDLASQSHAMDTLATTELLVRAISSSTSSLSGEGGGVVVSNLDPRAKSSALPPKQLFPEVMATRVRAEEFAYHVPGGAKFDRVLCHVPSTGDGVLASPKAWTAWNAASARAVVPMQVATAMAAADVLTAGGKMCYLTSSLNPVENEAVVATLLHNANGALVLCEAKGVGALPRFSLPLLQMDSLGESAGAKQENLSNEDAAKVVRIHPQHAITGGFFLAVFEKKHAQPIDWTERITHSAISAARDALVSLKVLRAEASLSIPPMSTFTPAALLQQYERQQHKVGGETKKKKKEEETSSEVGLRAPSTVLPMVNQAEIRLVSRGALDMLRRLTTTATESGVEVVYCGAVLAHDHERILDRMTAPWLVDLLDASVHVVELDFSTSAQLHAAINDDEDDAAANQEKDEESSKKVNRKSKIRVENIRRFLPDTVPESCSFLVRAMLHPTRDHKAGGDDEDEGDKDNDDDNVDDDDMDDEGHAAQKKSHAAPVRGKAHMSAAERRKLKKAAKKQQHSSGASSSSSTSTSSTREPRAREPRGLPSVTMVAFRHEDDKVEILDDAALRLDSVRAVFRGVVLPF